MQTDNEASQETEAKSVAQPDPEEEARRKKAERIARRRRERAKRDIESGEIMPTAEDATMKPRHWGVLFSFFLLVAAPIAVLGYYMMGVAVEQYASTAGFSVRKEDVKSPAEVLGGIGSFLGGSGSGETDMLFEYIQSQELVAAIDDKLDLVAHYSAPYDVDPIFALNPDSSIEDLLVYWGRIVRITYDNGTGLMNLRVLAFTPEMAQNLAAEIISESQILVNQLNAQARSDSLGYAEQDLADAVARLKAAREALVAFRSRTQIVDPQSDLQGQMGILNSLQAQLAEALIELDLIVQEALPGDPRVTQAQRRIEVIRERIDEERLAYTNDEGPNG
ncbi:MAG: sugar transporter, partial [Rhodobacterales bacterium]